MPKTAPDLRPCEGATLEDLDPALIRAYQEELDHRQPGNPLARKPMEAMLAEVGAATRYRGRLRPTLAGMLFFGRFPQNFFPAFSITFVHFAGVTTTRSGPDEPLYLDNREFRGTLPHMIDSARATIYEKLGKRAVIDGFVRHDVPDYPEVAYREAIVNAIAHRDYTLDGTSIQVRLFANRLEVQSPGGLGGHLTVDNIAYEQYTRNPHIVRLLEELGYMERRGLGVDQMIYAMSNASLEPPIFEDRRTSFWVTLKGATMGPVLPDVSDLGLNDRQAMALLYLRSHGRLTNRTYQEQFEVSERTALYDLQGLVEAGLAIPVSSGRGRYYIPRE